MNESQRRWKDSPGYTGSVKYNNKSIKIHKSKLMNIKVYEPQQVHKSTIKYAKRHCGAVYPDN